MVWCRVWLAFAWVQVSFRSSVGKSAALSMRTPVDHPTLSAQVRRWILFLTSCRPWARQSRLSRLRRPRGNDYCRRHLGKSASWLCGRLAVGFGCAFHDSRSLIVTQSWTTTPQQWRRAIRRAGQMVWCRVWLAFAWVQVSFRSSLGKSTALSMRTPVDHPTLSAQVRRWILFLTSCRPCARQGRLFDRLGGNDYFRRHLGKSASWLCGRLAVGFGCAFHDSRSLIVTQSWTTTPQRWTQVTRRALQMVWCRASCVS